MEVAVALVLSPPPPTTKETDSAMLPPFDLLRHGEPAAEAIRPTLRPPLRPPPRPSSFSPDGAER